MRAKFHGARSVHDQRGWDVLIAIGYVRSRRAGERVMTGIERFLAKRLKLKINKAKSAVAAPRMRKFLGFSFTIGASIKRRLAPQTVAQFKARVCRAISMARLLRLLRDSIGVART
jgi:hypothetical protein